MGFVERAADLDMIRLNQIDEKDLLMRLRAGDEMAFDHLYKTYSNRIYGKLLKLTGVESIAEELLQETFVTVWEKRHTINPEMTFKPWLYRVAENKVYYFYRKASRDAKLQQHLIENFTELYSYIEEDLCLQESRQLLRLAIGRLSPQRRKVFELCKLEGRSYAEAAEILGVSVSTVDNHLVKATKLVRRYVFYSRNAAIAMATAFFLNH